MRAKILGEAAGLECIHAAGEALGLDGYEGESRGEHEDLNLHYAEAAAGESEAEVGLARRHREAAGRVERGDAHDEAYAAPQSIEQTLDLMLDGVGAYEGEAWWPQLRAGETWQSLSFEKAAWDLQEVCDEECLLGELEVVGDFEVATGEAGVLQAGEECWDSHVLSFVGDGEIAKHAHLVGPGELAETLLEAKSGYQAEVGVEEAA